MRLNISAWSIRRPVPAIVLFSVLTLLGVISFMTLPVTRFPEHRHAARLDHRRPVGRRAGRAREPGHQGGRGRRRQHHRRQAHHVDRHRRHVDDGHGVPPRDQPGPRPQRRQGRHRQDPPRSAARHQRADRPAHRRRGPVDPHLRGLLAGHDARAALLACRRRHQAPAAGPEGRRPRRALRRRRSRDPHPARSRPPARLRHHRRRGQRPGARHQRRSGRRSRRGRRPGAGDPHARRRTTSRGAGRHQDPASGRARTYACPISAR